MFEMFSEKARHHREAKRLRRIGDFQRSGEFFELAQRLDEAMEMYQKAHSHLPAARLYEKMGKLREAAGQYESAGSYDVAAVLYTKIGEPQRAAQIYQRAGLHFKAGMLLQQTRNFREAAACFEKAGQEIRAAECFHAAGQSQQAARMYKVLLERILDASEQQLVKSEEEQRLALQAAECLEKVKDHTAAAEGYRFGGDYRKAAELFVRLQRPREAAEMFFQAHEYEKAMTLVHNHGLAAFDAAELAEVQRQAGRHAEAAALFEVAEMWLPAADEYLAMGQPRKAGALYEKAEDHQNAAYVYTEAGMHEEAAEAYIKAKLHSQAAEAFLRGGKPARAADLHSQAGEHFKAGQLLLGLGRDDEALGELQRVPNDDERYLEASDQVGLIFLRKGLLAMAVDRYRTALRGRSLSESTRPLFFNLAGALERAGKDQNALTIYQRIATADFSYRGVGARIEQLRQRSADERALATKPLMANRLGGAEPKEVFDGRYEIIERIADGGMGSVYKARDLELGEVIALKLLRRTDTTTVERLKRELRLARKLVHPNIVRLFHFSESDNVYFLCMEFVEGQTLKSQIVEKGAFPTVEAVEIITQIAKALEAAHKAGVIHRDIKPQNVLIDSRHVVKVLDFGIACAIEETVSLTLEGEVVGTPEYMSPEQISAKPADARADLYSLGVLAYELVTGQVPFRAETPVATVLQHLRQLPRPPSEIQPLVPPELERIILKLLQKDPADRYPSAPDLLLDLGHLEQ